MNILKVPVTPDDHIQGNINAPITLVEYGDFQCPYCGAAFPIIKEVQNNFGDQLRFVFRHFPLSEVHEFAKAAASTAEFAGTYHKFWEMHDEIYENQDMLSEEMLTQLADSMGLNSKELLKAIKNNKFESKIQKDFMGGVRSGVNGTPSLFINDHRYSGSVDFDSIVQAIELVELKK